MVSTGSTSGGHRDHTVVELVETTTDEGVR